MPVVHLTARMRRPHALFWEHDHASWFWERVREAYPGVLGLCLMPNHPHLLADVVDPGAARDGFARTCGHLQRRVGLHDLWESVPGAEVIAGRQKLMRSLRYLALNPPRARLCDCPLEWLWSTHRDLVGAAAQPLVRPEVVARLTGIRRARSAEWLHAYCSSDPAVRVEGTGFPTAALRQALPSFALEAVAAAAAVASRSGRADIARRGLPRTLFVQLSRHQGWTDAALVGRACGVAPNGIRKAWRQPPHPGLPAATKCLADHHLLHPVQRPRSPARRDFRGSERAQRG